MEEELEDFEIDAIQDSFEEYYYKDYLGDLLKMRKYFIELLFFL